MAGLRDILIRIKGDADPLIKESKKAGRALGNFQGDVKKTSGVLGQFGGAIKAAALTFGAFHIGRFAKDAVQLGIDAKEAASAFDTVFGPAVDKASRTLEEFTENGAFTRLELQQATAILGNMAQGMGGTEEAAADLIAELVPLATDLASFNNIAGGGTEVLESFRSALTGEFEPLKRYGIVLKAAEVEQRALLMTGKESADQLTDLDKALAVIELSYEGAGKAVGDYERTADGAANTQRALNNKFKDAQAALGEALLPLYEQLLELLPQLIPVFEAIIAVLAKFVGWIMNAVEWMRELKGLIPGVGRDLGAIVGHLRDAVNEAAFANANSQFIGPPAPGAIEGFASGGIVPGPKGKPRLAVVHGGEEVIPPGGSSSVGAGTIVIPIHIGGQKIDEVIVRANERIRRRGRG